ncbi:MAG: hypothetical protein RBT63_01800 [Bdellovibrionales bacterium]|jgi:hypothetical protein|nr:hypothetical protein [Bdellovibrionales bacterium]
MIRSQYFRSRFLVVGAALCALIPCAALARVEYDASSLLIKNSDQVNQMIVAKIKRAQSLQAKQEDNDDGVIMAEPEAIENLKDAMRIALSRPDQDGARSNFYGRVRRELVDLNSLEQVLAELTEESLRELRGQDGPRRTATYVVILENMMAEIKPDASTTPAYIKILERIRDAKISITDKIRVQNLLRSMSIPISPSDTAAKILKSTPGYGDQKKKK